MSVWIDTAIAPDAATAAAAAQALGADSVNVYLGGRFSAGRGWTLGLDDQLELEGLGTLLTWVALEPGQGGYEVGHQDGLDALAAGAGWPAWGICYDLEPVTWDADPAGAAQACAGFRDAVQQGGRRAVLYGVVRTILGAAAGYDAVWIAEPGVQDPAAAGVPGFQGRRSVQGGQGSFQGLLWDLSFSEFALTGGRPMTETAARPDGGTDHYTLVDTHVEHTVIDFSGQITFRDTLPGSWSALLKAGYRGTLPFVQGLGSDVARSAFEATDPGPGWVLAPKP